MIDLHNITAQELLSPQSGLVADESVDLILTDPPYIIAQKSGFAKGGDKRFNSVDHDFGAWDRGEDGAFAMADLDDVVRALPRVMRPGATAIVWFDLWKMSDLVKVMEAVGFEGVTMIEWLKTNPVPINSRKTYLSNAREIAIVGYKPGARPTYHADRVAPDAAATGTFEHPIESRKGRFHPTEKSVRLFEDMIQLHTDPGDLVLDCFSGSGTTAAVCQATGRRFVGSELDPDYYQKSLARLATPAPKVLKPRRKAG